MSKKTDKPRKVYKRRGIVHVCFDGALFAPRLTSVGGDTDVDLSQPVKVVAEYFVDGEDSGRPRSVQIFQARFKKKGVRETWYETEIPTKAEMKSLLPDYGELMREKGSLKSSAKSEQKAA